METAQFHMCNRLALSCVTLLLFWTQVTVPSVIPCPRTSICVPIQDCPPEKVVNTHMSTGSGHPGTFYCPLGQPGRQGVCCFVNHFEDAASTSEEDVMRSSRQSQASREAESFTAKILDEEEGRHQSDSDPHDFDDAVEMRVAPVLDDPRLHPSARALNPQLEDQHQQQQQPHQPALHPLLGRAAGGSFNSDVDDEAYERAKDEMKALKKNKKRYSKYQKDSYEKAESGYGDTYKNYNEYHKAMGSSSSSNKYSSGSGHSGYGHKYGHSGSGGYSSYEEEEDDDEYYGHTKYNYEEDDDEYYGHGGSGYGYGKGGYGHKYKGGDKYSHGGYNKAHHGRKYYGSTVDFENDPWTPYIMGCVAQCIYSKNTQMYQQSYGYGSGGGGGGYGYGHGGGYGGGYGGGGGYGY